MTKGQSHGAQTDADRASFHAHVLIHTLRLGFPTCKQDATVGYTVTEQSVNGQEAGEQSVWGPKYTVGPRSQAGPRPLRSEAGGRAHWCPAARGPWPRWAQGLCPEPGWREKAQLSLQREMRLRGKQRHEELLPSSARPRRVKGPLALDRRRACPPPQA